MEENKDLQDIILEPEEESSGKFRKIITTVISLIILFLIVVIVVKFINSGDDDEQMMVAGTNALILPEEPLAPVLPDNNSFEQVPMTQTPASQTPASQAPAPQTPTSKTPVTQTPPTKMLEEKDEPRATAIKSPSVDLSAPTQVPKPEAIEFNENAKKVEPIKVEPKVDTKSGPKQIVLKETEKTNGKRLEETLKTGKSTTTAKKEESTKAPKKSSDKNVQNGQSYIQVSSIAKFDPKSPLIKKLQSAGYSYKTYTTKVNGKDTTKILVGPFSGAELKENLGKIKADISKDAFIYKIK